MSTGFGSIENIPRVEEPHSDMNRESNGQVHVVSGVTFLEWKFYIEKSESIQISDSYFLHVTVTLNQV